MSILKDVVKTVVKGKTGSLNYSSPFGYREFTYNGKLFKGDHNGFDITTLGEIVPIAKGKVTACRDGITGYTESQASGNYVTLYHGNGVYSTYCHLDNGSVKVKVGDIVDVNTVLGTDTKKTTGFSTGLHLHFGIKVNGVWVDPVDYLQGKKVIADYVEPVQELPATPSSNTYKVVRGDTLSGIGAKYGIDWHLIYNANKGVIGDNPNLIKVGQVLTIPSNEKVYHTVVSGDTLYAIAKKYGTTWHTVYSLNKQLIGANPNLIRPGMKLVIK